MEKRPGQTPHAVDYEEIRNYLLDKKSTEKRYHDQGHSMKPLPELKPGQKILFLSPKDENQYIEGTVTSKASTPELIALNPKASSITIPNNISIP